MERDVRDGRHAGGRAYGYRPTPGKPGVMTICEEEAAVIRRIFADYIAGKTPRQIAGALNAEHIPPPRGTRWNASTINGNATRGHGLLLNPIYAGRLIWNRVRMVRDPDTGRRVSRPNPESEWQTADVPELAIVDAETWQAGTPSQEGSWWPTWQAWLATHSSGETKPPAMGAPDRGLTPLAEAPGTYVFQT